MNNGKSILKQIKHDARFFERFYIKPCPFCGGEAFIEKGVHSRNEEGYLYYTITCDNCGASIDGEAINSYQVNWTKAKVSVVDKWNRRTEENR